MTNDYPISRLTQQAPKALLCFCGWHPRTRDTLTQRIQGLFQRLSQEWEVFVYCPGLLPEKTADVNYTVGNVWVRSNGLERCHPEPKSRKMVELDLLDSLHSYVAEIRPDVIHLFDPDICQYPTLLSVLSDSTARTVVEIIEDPETSGGDNGNSESRWMQWSSVILESSLMVDVVIAPSLTLAKYLRKNLPFFVESVLEHTVGEQDISANVADRYATAWSSLYGGLTNALCRRFKLGCEVRPRVVDLLGYRHQDVVRRDGTLFYLDELFLYVLRHLERYDWRAESSDCTAVLPEVAQVTHDVILANNLVLKIDEAVSPIS